MGVGITNATREQIWHRIGNGNDVSINGKTCEVIWNAVLGILEKWCGDGGQEVARLWYWSRFHGSEEEIIL